MVALFFEDRESGRLQRSDHPTRALELDGVGYAIPQDPDSCGTDSHQVRSSDDLYERDRGRLAMWLRGHWSTVTLKTTVLEF